MTSFDVMLAAEQELTQFVKMVSDRAAMRLVLAFELTEAEQGILERLKDNLLAAQIRHENLNIAPQYICRSGRLLCRRSVPSV